MKKQKNTKPEDKLKEGFLKIFEATKEISSQVVKGFKEGYADKRKGRPKKKKQ